MVRKKDKTKKKPIQSRFRKIYDDMDNTLLSEILKPVEIVRDPIYIDSIRNSCICHLDRLRWSFGSFTETDKRLLVNNLRKVIPDLSKGGTGTPEDYKEGKKTALFANQSRYHNEYIDIVILWARDWSKSPCRDVHAELQLDCIDKYNYSGYKEIAIEVENVCGITINRKWLSYAEIAIDTLMDIHSKYLHNSILLRGINERQYFHWDNYIGDTIPGIDYTSDNWYQGNRGSKIHLHSHRCTHYPIDLVSGRYLYRMELRLQEGVKGNPFFNYGGNSINALIKNVDKILGEKLWWREPNPDKLSIPDLEYFKDKPVAYFVWSLMQRPGDAEVKHNQARKLWTRDKLPIPWAFV